MRLVPGPLFERQALNDVYEHRSGRRIAYGASGDTRKWLQTDLFAIKASCLAVRVCGAIPHNLSFNNKVLAIPFRDIRILNKPNNRYIVLNRSRRRRQLV